MSNTTTTTTTSSPKYEEGSEKVAEKVAEKDFTATTTWPPHSTTITAEISTKQLHKDHQFNDETHIHNDCDNDTKSTNHTVHNRDTKTNQNQDNENETIPQSIPQSEDTHNITAAFNDDAMFPDNLSDIDHINNEDVITDVMKDSIAPSSNDPFSNFTGDNDFDSFNDAFDSLEDAFNDAYNEQQQTQPPHVVSPHTASSTLANKRFKTISTTTTTTTTTKHIPVDIMSFLHPSASPLNLPTPTTPHQPTT
jgi:hypothetical protein